MKILLLHSDDDPSRTPWAQRTWDRVVDMGIPGLDTYQAWSDLFHCPVGPLPKLDHEDLARVRQLLFAGLGRMVDAHGFDWWELISIEYHERAERILALEKLAEQIGADDEVFVSRPGFDGQVMARLLGREVRPLLPADSSFRRMLRRFEASANLTLAQVGQILGDKYDADYGIRRFTARGAPRCQRPVVLLPTAYVNVSRTGLAYASALRDRDFLLVTTRQSGWVSDPPKNVKTARLASYAPGRLAPSQVEYQYLLGQWRNLRAEFRECRELSVLAQLGSLECVPSMLRDGLGVRDAWLQVFDREPVIAVLCADDSNTYTRLPLLIARERGLPAIACHHGALDGRHFIKRNHADVILAKGRMEKDYLVRVCGVAESEVEVGAPPRQNSSLWPRHKNAIVFFSEPHENAGGRCLELYREVIPGLARIASSRQLQLVIKLHPQESLRERQGLVNAVLTPEQSEVVRIVEGRLSEELLQQAWFAVTVVSTTAVECTLRGIPVFLCAWLDYTNYGYADQFVRFGAGARLNTREEIPEIPGRVEDFSPANPRDLWEPIAAERLDQLLTARQPLEVAAAV